MLLFWNDCLISAPKISVTVSYTIHLRDGFPQFAAGLAGFDLLWHRSPLDASFDTKLSRSTLYWSASAQMSHPFIQFQYHCICIIRVRHQQCFAQGWQFFCFFLSMRSPMPSILQRSVLFLVNSFALHRLSRSLLFVLLNRHSVWDFLDFAFYMLCSDISAFHSGLDHFAQCLRSCNADHEQ